MPKTAPPVGTASDVEKNTATEVFEEADIPVAAPATSEEPPKHKSSGLGLALLQGAQIANEEGAATILALDVPDNPSGYIAVKGRRRTPRIHKAGREYHLATPCFLLIRPSSNHDDTE